MGCGLSRSESPPPASTKSLGSTESSSSTLRIDDPLSPEIDALKTFIESDQTLGGLFQDMFTQIPDKAPYMTDPSGGPQVRSYTEPLSTLNTIIKTAPPFTISPSTSADTGFHPGTPIRFTLNWPMGTDAGKQALADSQVNAAFLAILSAWATYLKSPASTSVLNDTNDGWFGPAAMKAMPGFDDTYVCDPKAAAKGFTSWDDFFTRKFCQGFRPVELPDQNDLINAPCEATFFKSSKNVKYSDTFDLKEQPYSLEHMLAGDYRAYRFEGGTVFQANLDSVSYHRWHSPVNGTISQTIVVPGT